MNEARIVPINNEYSQLSGPKHGEVSMAVLIGPTELMRVVKTVLGSTMDSARKDLDMSPSASEAPLREICATCFLHSSHRGKPVNVGSGTSSIPASWSPQHEGNLTGICTGMREPEGQQSSLIAIAVLRMLLEPKNSPAIKIPVVGNCGLIPQEIFNNH